MSRSDKNNNSTLPEVWIKRITRGLKSVITYDKDDHDVRINWIDWIIEKSDYTIYNDKDTSVGTLKLKALIH